MKFSSLNTIMSSSRSIHETKTFRAIYKRVLKHFRVKQPYTALENSCLCEIKQHWYRTPLFVSRGFNFPKVTNLLVQIIQPKLKLRRRACFCSTWQHNNSWSQHKSVIEVDDDTLKTELFRGRPNLHLRSSFQLTFWSINFSTFFRLAISSFSRVQNE